ncbi:MAG: D-glycero-beta-D-manno-heptose 1-phosphate adenylyltransferase [Gemmatimonadota bacterium]|nr:MAG: D-glycero-beta-D-manno-heptose 1-phosphate adenylyltransferase [Gemmatimonadota bacterium]
MSADDKLPEVLGRKILDRDEARRQFGPGRGFRLVFTNGCFDILHRGHVEILIQARALGDRLVVGLNSDESVHRLKGSGRPLQPQLDRAACLAALESVDAVVIFEEETPTELIASLRPDIWVKGGDYTPEALVELKALEAVGGQLVILPLLEGRSTTELLDRAARAAEGTS